MSVTELRRRAKKTIDELSGAKLRFVTDFLGYVKDRKSNGATQELLEIPGFIESFSRGKKDIRAGRATPWRMALESSQPLLEKMARKAREAHRRSKTSRKGFDEI